MMEVQQKILVFGAYGGIGHVLCEQLVNQGNQVYLVGRHADKISSLANTLQQPFGLCDATQFDQVENIFVKVLEAWGHVDGVVSLIGSLQLKPAHLLTETDWLNCLHTNLTSAFAIVRSLTKHQNQHPTSTVLTSTAAAHLGFANHEAISAAKAGVEGLMKAAACSYAKRGFRFNCVAPGLTETPLTRQVFDSERGKAYSQSLHPLGRLGKPEDITSAIRFLLSPENDWITGQVLTVDGGLSSLKV